VLLCFLDRPGILLNIGWIVHEEAMELKGWALAALAALVAASVAAVAYIMLTGVPRGDGSYNEPYLVILWDDFDLASYSGRVILVDVGATWCGPCAMEAEELKTVRDEFSQDELAIISIFYDSKDNPHTVAEYAREHRITWDVVYGRSMAEALSRYFQFSCIPLYSFSTRTSIRRSAASV